MGEKEKTPEERIREIEQKAKQQGRSITIISLTLLIAIIGYGIWFHVIFERLRDIQSDFLIHLDQFGNLLECIKSLLLN